MPLASSPCVQCRRQRALVIAHPPPNSGCLSQEDRGASTSQIATLEGWFGSIPPAKVSVVGISETGVFMLGTGTGKAILD
jgi:hypothetical protein